MCGHTKGWGQGMSLITAESGKGRATGMRRCLMVEGTHRAALSNKKKTEIGERSRYDL